MHLSKSILVLLPLLAVISALPQDPPAAAAPAATAPADAVSADAVSADAVSADVVSPGLEAPADKASASLLAAAGPDSGHDDDSEDKSALSKSAGDAHSKSKSDDDDDDYDDAPKSSGQGPRLAANAVSTFGRTRIFDNFYVGEYFGLESTKRWTTCMSVKRQTGRWKLATTYCPDGMVIPDTPSAVTFSWKPAQNGGANLAWRTRDGSELCALEKHTGTWFKPCDGKSTRYTLGAPNKEGRFSVINADKTNRCLDAEMHHAMRSKLCLKNSDDQKWLKLRAGHFTS